MPNTYRIQVQTNDPCDGVPYNDAQYFPNSVTFAGIPDDMTWKEIKENLEPIVQKEQDIRIANVLESRLHPIVQPEPTEAELIALKQSLADELQQRIDQITAQTAEIDSKIQAIEASKIQPIEEKPL